MSQEFDILIIEDEPVIVNATSTVLRRDGFKIDQTFGAAEALGKLQSNQYKLIISDLMLPKISGFEVIKEVKAINPEIPIIIMTGYAMRENAVDSFKAGAFDFLPKPFDIDELLAVVHRAMRCVEQKAETESNKKVFQAALEKNRGNDRQDNYYFLGRHSWANVDREGITVLGVGETIVAHVSEIQTIEFPAMNTFIWQGNLCVKIIAEQHFIHSVWSPLSGEVIAVNHDLEKNPNLLSSDPFNLGWLLKIMPTNLEVELPNLTKHSS